MTETTRKPRYDRVQDQLLAISDKQPDRRGTTRYHDTPWNRAFGLGPFGRKDLTKAEDSAV